MKITGDWLTHPGTQVLCALLVRAGHQALFVGGCVRNALLAAPVADIDIATDAQPAKVAALAQAAGLRTIPTGIEHGTVTVIVGDLPHEVTTFRRDVETDGRHARVQFSTRIEEDASRRDFTMNALYARPDGELVDPLQGLPDLLARRVRFVGDPAARIAEDYLRILRFFRFHAWYGDTAAGPDTEALAAIAAGAEGLERVSRERIGSEMRKLLAATDPAPALAMMQICGVLARAVPGADPRALAPLIHLEARMPPHWLRRLAVIGGVDPAAALRLSRAEQTVLAQLQRATSLPLREAAWRLGSEIATDAALITAASLGQPLPPDGQAIIARAAAARFPVTPADLMPALQGKALGQRLALLEARWIASDFGLDRDALLAGLP